MKEPDKEIDRLASAVIGAAIEVHRQLGPGFLESIYEAALCKELRMRNIPFEKQKTIQILYKGDTVGEHRIDIFVNKKLIVELKTVDELAPVHKAQVISYLKATGCRLGLLINFNVSLLKDGIKRIILS